MATRVARKINPNNDSYQRHLAISTRIIKLPNFTTI